MKKLLLLLISVLSFAQSTNAACQIGDFSFEVNISAKTFGLASVYDLVPFGEDDYVSVVNVKTEREYRYEKGLFSDDGAGNFEIQAVNPVAYRYFNLFHDHEAWHEGLSGEFNHPIAGIVDLSSVKNCDFNKLFN